MKKWFFLLYLCSLYSPLVSEEGFTPYLPEELCSWNRRTPRNCPPKPPETKPISLISKTKKKKQPKNNLQIGGSYTYAHIATNGQPSTSGNLYGVQALYEFRPINRIYVGIPFTWKNGSTDGSGISRSLLEFDAQEHIGYTWGSARKGRMFSLYSGFGYRYYGEKVRQSSSSIRCRYNEFYFPIGILLDGRLNSLTSMGLNFQWMPQIFPTLTISPLNGARWILSNQLANFRAEVPITLAFSDKRQFSILLRPFFEYWRDGHTSAKTQQGLLLNIPGNRYLFGGIDVNLVYSF